MDIRPPYQAAKFLSLEPGSFFAGKLKKRPVFGFTIRKSRETQEPSFVALSPTSSNQPSACSISLFEVDDPTVLFYEGAYVRLDDHLVAVKNARQPMNEGACIICTDEKFFLPFENGSGTVYADLDSGEVRGYLPGPEIALHCHFTVCVDDEAEDRPHVVARYPDAFEA